MIRPVYNSKSVFLLLLLLLLLLLPLIHKYLLSFFESLFFFCRCNINMYFSWNLLFKSLFSKYTIYVDRVIFYAIFLYYHLFSLLCCPTLLVAFLQNGLYSVFYLSGYLGCLPFLGLSFNPSISSSLIFLTIGKPSLCFCESLATGVAILS